MEHFLTSIEDGRFFFVIYFIFVARTHVFHVNGLLFFQIDRITTLCSDLFRTNMLCHFCGGTELPLRLRNTTACVNCQLAVEYRGASFYIMNASLMTDDSMRYVLIVRDRTPTVCLLRVNLSVTYYQRSGEIAINVRENELFCSGL